MAGNPPVDVQQFGQSIWLDFIRRSTTRGGELARMIAEDGLLGVTSNPTIFQQAIGNSADYDDSIGSMLDLDGSAIFEALAVDDIREALELFRPVYERTGGRDGYVSLEVSPLIANDTETTTDEAKRLFKLVERPNTMIKIPATDAGLPAIEEAIASGVNVNVTLIFSVENYVAVAEAYIRGLERRLEAGLPVDKIASVASFFVSRIDAAVDRMLDNNIRAAQTRGDLTRVSLNNQLKGKAAVANAKIAYKRFKELFYGERFARLREAGAMPQRVLWASTSTKNPAYPDTLYVDSLIGQDTVNTLPPKTLVAFKDHGTVAATLDGDYDDAEKTMDMLAEVGIDFQHVTMQLQTDGVESFVESFNTLIQQVEAKRDVLKTGVMAQQEVTLGVHQEAVEAAIEKLAEAHINPRLWQHDGSIWKDNPQVRQKIENRLGWLDIQRTIDLEKLHALANRSWSFNPSHVVLLGMGGSSLAPEVLYQTFGSAPNRPAFVMLDSTDPVQIRNVERQIDLPNTIFIVSSKSGGTIETLSFYRYFFEKTGGNGGQFIAITDPGSQLEAEARAKSFAEVFHNPEDIGGRYSALSYFGLVPAALLGIDIDELWASAERMMLACSVNIPHENHPGIWLGAIMGALAHEGRDKVTLFTSPSIESFGNWIEQLIAESTGKEGRGILPVVGATVGKPHDYSTDRLFVYLRVEGDDNAELDAGTLALQQAGFPCVVLRLDDKYAIGGEFFRWEYATAVAGKLLDINPFDEPNVTESKNNTSRLLDYYKEHTTLPTSDPLVEAAKVQLYADERTSKMLGELCTQHQFQHNTLSGLLAAQLNATQAGDYFALCAYLPVTAEIDEKLEEIRRRLRHVTRRAVTLGYGPRFLHSTGQLHKGGANNGVFIQITRDIDANDLPIPGASYTFGILQAAQAAGDLEALQSKHRRAVRWHITGDVIAGLNKLLDAIELAGERKQ